MSEGIETNDYSYGES